jgi:hypothetical protein
MGTRVARDSLRGVSSLRAICRDAPWLASVTGLGDFAAAAEFSVGAVETVSFPSSFLGDFAFGMMRVLLNILGQGWLNLMSAIANTSPC